MNGATSRFYSWVVAVVLILTAVLLSGLLSHLPQASLGGIILYAAWTLVDRKSAGAACDACAGARSW